MLFPAVDFSALQYRSQEPAKRPPSPWFPRKCHWFIDTLGLLDAAGFFGNGDVLGGGEYGGFLGYCLGEVVEVLWGFGEGLVGCRTDAQCFECSNRHFLNIIVCQPSSFKTKTRI